MLSAMQICADAISRRRELAASYTRFLDTLNGMRRLEEIRKFRSLDYCAKKARIFALMNRRCAARLARSLCFDSVIPSASEGPHDRRTMYETMRHVAPEAAANRSS